MDELTDQDRETIQNRSYQIMMSGWKIDPGTAQLIAFLEWRVERLEDRLKELQNVSSDSQN